MSNAPKTPPDSDWEECPVCLGTEGYSPAEGEWVDCDNCAGQGGHTLSAVCDPCVRLQRHPDYRCPDCPDKAVAGCVSCQLVYPSALPGHRCEKCGRALMVMMIVPLEPLLTPPESLLFDCDHCGDGDALRAGEACAYCAMVKEA